MNKNVLKYQQDVASEVLDELMVSISPNAIVAGGAARDWYFNKEASDIDIFFYRPDLLTLHTTQRAFKAVGLEVEPLGEDSNWKETYQQNPMVYKVYDCIYFDVKFQFIQTSIPTFGVVNTFPLNMSRIWFKGGRIDPYEEFLTGVKHKALVKMSDLYADGNKYITKIRNKFPDYRYYPSELEFYKSLARGK